MGLNMAQSRMNFGDPSQFSDWTRYAGFDPNKPIIGVAPPSTGGMAPVSPTMAQVGQRVSDIGTQIGQGNFMGALKTAQSGTAVVPGVPAVAKNTPMPVDKDGDGMISEWEE